jgi:hypothetical protein
VEVPTGTLAPGRKRPDARPYLAFLFNCCLCLLPSRSTSRSPSRVLLLRPLQCMLAPGRKRPDARSLPVPSLQFDALEIGTGRTISPALSLPASLSVLFSKVSRMRTLRALCRCRSIHSILIPIDRKGFRPHIIANPLALPTMTIALANAPEQDQHRDQRGATKQRSQSNTVTARISHSGHPVRSRQAASGLTLAPIRPSRCRPPCAFLFFAPTEMGGVRVVAIVGDQRPVSEDGGAA